MYRTITFLFLLTACCRAAEPVPVHTHGMDLSESEKRLLEQKAASGDTSAAMRLWEYYALEHHDDDLVSADRWLCRAAELGDATAQWNLGYSLKEGYRPNSAFPECARQFGKTRKAAIQKLLETAARSVGSACFELASAYEDGYFGAKNLVKARGYFAQGAHLNDEQCWEKLADYYRRGLGGPRDEAEAYYWMSLDARCSSPDNILGVKAWKNREEVAQHLSPAALESAWQRIDAFIAKVAASKVTPDSPRFLPGLQGLEDQHRNRLKQKPTSLGSTPLGSPTDSPRSR